MDRRSVFGTLNYLVPGVPPSPLIFWNHGFSRRLSLKSLMSKNL